jgi:hypothetical protein
VRCCCLLVGCPAGLAVGCVLGEPVQQLAPGQSGCRRRHAAVSEQRARGRGSCAGRGQCDEHSPVKIARVCVCYADAVTRINGAPHLARQLQEARQRLVRVAHYCYQQSCMKTAPDHTHALWSVPKMLATKHTW